MTVTVRPDSETELAAALHDTAGPVRLLGGGSRQQRLPDPGAATRIELAGLDRIERLDAGDQTCTVGPGVRREELDAALAPHELCLPCAGTGTIGGLFASDPIGAVTTGGPQPRSLLLGIDAVLRDGTEFRSGARVTKSVAGFDLHKLFVGSQGRLFAVTRLHLRLKPRPRVSRWFATAATTPAEALALLQRLRGEAVPPAALHLVRDRNGARVVGRVDGRAGIVERTFAAHGLADAAPFERLQLEPPADGEVLAGSLRPSQTVQLLDLAPPDAEFVLHGGGRFELALGGATETDALLTRLPELPAHACIVRGRPDRRGRGTALDPGQSRLAATLTRALDPDGTLV
ncbi:MAG: FAD-binding oxidoreductase [Planctomycetes bacterium]|nr:FAD-binding oxidoreductase [Planctomycetota bacterium]